MGRGVAQSAILCGGKTDFAFVSQSQADGPAFEPNPQRFSFKLSD